MKYRLLSDRPGISHDNGALYILVIHPAERLLRDKFLLGSRAHKIEQTTLEIPRGRWGVSELALRR